MNPRFVNQFAFPHSTVEARSKEATNSREGKKLHDLKEELTVNP